MMFAWLIVWNIRQSTVYYQMTLRLDHAKVCLFKRKVLNHIVFILGLSAVSGHSEDSQDHITWLRFDGHGISTLCKYLLFVDAT